MSSEIKMRAKMKVHLVTNSPDVVDDKPTSQTVLFEGVAANAYPSDGLDENNTFAKYTPQASLKIVVNNPALIGAFAVGDAFYLDFTPAAV